MERCRGHGRASVGPSLRRGAGAWGRGWRRIDGARVLHESHGALLGCAVSASGLRGRERRSHSRELGQCINGHPMLSSEQALGNECLCMVRSAQVRGRRSSYCNFENLEIRIGFTPGPSNIPVLTVSASLSPAHTKRTWCCGTLSMFGRTASLLIVSTRRSGPGL
jgi:hypothetical protein